MFCRRSLKLHARALCRRRSRVGASRDTAQDPTARAPRHLRQLSLSQGINPAIVSRRLGHATVTFTVDIYPRMLPQVDAHAAEVVAAFGGRASLPNQSP